MEEAFVQRLKIGKDVEKKTLPLIYPYLYRCATDEEDMNEAVDLVCKFPRVAIRGRKIEYFHPFWSQITIRNESYGDKLSEYQKFRQGFCDLMVYVYYDKELNIKEWLLIDLERFRLNCD